jgi:cytosine/adenosine deaminase-related metal-dependent hydrolase
LTQVTAGAGHESGSNGGVGAHQHRNLERARDGILSPDVTLIHSTGLTSEAWKAMGETGTTVALAPTSDAQIGLETAIPAIDEALSVGIRPGLSIDVEVALAGDMFTQMRALHAIQRMRAVNAAYGTSGDLSRITTHDVLDFATSRAPAPTAWPASPAHSPRARRPTCWSSRPRT